MTKNFEKPFYSLRIIKKQCGLLVTVNGAFLAQWGDGAAVTMEFPINQWLKNGSNDFNFHLMNIKDEKTGKAEQLIEGEFSIELTVKENNSSESYVISKTQYSGNNLPRDASTGSVDFSNLHKLGVSITGSSVESQFDIVDGEVLYSSSGEYKVGEYIHGVGMTHAQKIEHKVSLPVPFPLWRFFSADELLPKSKMNKDSWISSRKDINKAYEPIWKAIEEKNSECLDELFNNRSAEYDLAFYKESGQSNFEFVAHILSITADEKWILKEIDFSKNDISVSENKKISWLSKPKNPMDASLKFQHKSASIVRDVPLFLSKFNGQWEIVR